jgi:hypothetical protein
MWKSSCSKKPAKSKKLLFVGFHMAKNIAKKSPKGQAKPALLGEKTTQNPHSGRWCGLCCL